MKYLRPSFHGDVLSRPLGGVRFAAGLLLDGVPKKKYLLPGLMSLWLPQYYQRED
jgi:hypothetical protein